MANRRTITIEVTGEEVDAIIGALAQQETVLSDQIESGDRVHSAAREIDAGNRVIAKIQEAMKR